MATSVASGLSCLRTTFYHSTRSNCQLIRASTALRLKPVHVFRQPRQLGCGVKSLAVCAAAASEAATVKIIVQGLNVAVTPAIKEYVDKRVNNAVSSFEVVVREVDVKLRVHGGDATKGPKEQVTEITLYTYRNGVIRVVDKEDNLYTSIDKVCDKLSRKLRKLKEVALTKGKWPKHKAHPRNSEALAEELEMDESLASMDDVATPPVPTPPVQLESLPEQVFRAKYLYLEAMSIEEAVEGLQNIDHDFYVYLDQSTQCVHVLYKRDAGGYGVIVPQIMKNGSWVEHS